MEFNESFPENNSSNLKLDRFPKTDKTNVQAWSSADNYLVTFAVNNELLNNQGCVYNDTYGFISLNLSRRSTYYVTDLKSQVDSLVFNANKCGLDINIENNYSPVDSLPKKIDFALIKIPKSVDLFELYLKHIHSNLNENGIVVCGFMTKYFTKQYLQIAEKYFSSVKQTKAWKKSRLIILEDKLDIKVETNLLNSIDSEWGLIQQYFGVFSSDHIDFATQYLINNIVIPPNTSNVLDLASGNGILAKVLQQIQSNLNIHLVDDSLLAIESSKLNLDDTTCEFHQRYDLTNFESNYFDFIISNPPFHVGFEINVNLPLALFEDAYRVLKEGGTFQMVSNNHLNYKPHLEKMFTEVILSASNPKYTVYNCIK